MAQTTSSDIAYFIFAVFFVFLALVFSFIFSLWVNRRRTTPSPYTGHPLRKGSELPSQTIEKVLRFLYDMHEYDNRLFNLNLAAFCRQTGRIFPNAMTWYGVIAVDWDFLKHKFPGEFVSWGSLTEEQKTIIRERHLSLEGFQTEISSTKPSPRAVEPEYAFAKPGPLYVDVRTGILVGWKCVPDTELEVLIVQRPFEKYLPGITKI